MSKQYFPYLLSWDICFLLFDIEVISLKLIESYNFLCINIQKCIPNGQNRRRSLRLEVGENHN